MNDSSSSISAMLDECGSSLPDSHTEFAEIDPDLFSAYLAWRTEILDTGVIPRTQKLLMVVALLTAQKDVAPLKIYSAIARSEGASAQELNEALRVGILFSGGAGIAAAANVVDLLKEK